MTEGRVFAVSDLHGRLDLLRQIQDFLNPEDKVYCLGDCGDRGPNPWETIKEALRDKRFICLMGNHEKMLIDAIEEFKRYDTMGDKYHLLCYNGGERTFDEWSFEIYREEWYGLLRKLPYTAKYENESGYNVLMSHAGYTPNKRDLNDYDLIWSRKHFHDVWPEGHDMDIIIHGHTPIPNMVDEFQFFSGISTPPNGAFWYANTHKIDIDCGSFFTNKTVLINLDTFDEHIFKGE